jgi:hypothetical protein
LNTVYGLGLLYKAQGKGKEAVVLIERAMNGYEKVFGPDYRWTIEAASNLVDLYQEEGRIEEANPISIRYLIVHS